jgi:hypothetical protein
MQVKVPSVLNVVRLLEFAAFFVTISSAVSAVATSPLFRPDTQVLYLNRMQCS